MTEANVQPLFAAQQPAEERRLQPSYIAAVMAALDMASARILALIAVLGSVGIWAYAAYDPTILRLYAGAGMSIGVLFPCLYLAWRKG